MLWGSMEARKAAAEGEAEHVDIAGDLSALCMLTFSCWVWCTLIISCCCCAAFEALKADYEAQTAELSQVQWCSVTVQCSAVVQWCSGAVVQCSGAVVQCCCGVLRCYVGAVLCWCSAALCEDCQADHTA